MKEVINLGHPKAPLLQLFESMGNTFEVQIIQIIDLSLHFTCPQVRKQNNRKVASGVYFSFLGCLLKMVNKS